MGKAQILDFDKNDLDQYKNTELQLSVIENAINLISGRNGLNEIIDNVLKNLVNVLGYTFSGVLLFNEEGNLQVRKHHVSRLFQKLSEKALGVSFSDFVLVKSSKDYRQNFLLKAAIDGKIYESADLFSFAYPLIRSKRITSIIQKLSGLKYFYAIPLINNKQLLGVLTVARSTKDKNIISNDAILTKFSQVISIAINDARVLETQKAQYQELQSAYKKLEEMHQLQSLDRAKSEFIRVASHQFRTPLSGIRFEAEYILEKRERGDLAANEAVDGIILIYERILFLIRTLNDIFDVLEIDQGEAKIKKEETSFAEVAKDAENIIRQPFVYTQNTKKLTIDIKSVKQPILIDREKVKRILVILLTNAFVFTDKNGEILLQAKIKGKGKNRALNILISDNGIGIPAAEKTKVFEKFYRASNASRAVPNGTGLGLFIVKTFVQMHGGEIVIKDTNGKGTIFDISLPV